VFACPSPPEGRIAYRLKYATRGATHRIMTPVEFIARLADATRPRLGPRLKTIPGDKYVALEEGTQSAWLSEILSPHAKDVVVAVMAESRGQMNDARDAYSDPEDCGACSPMGRSCHMNGG
jgi:hypothetical protein